MLKAMIKLNFYNPVVLTVEEFEEMEREVTARVAAGDVTVVERVLARLIVHNRWRYVEAKEQNELRGVQDGT